MCEDNKPLCEPENQTICPMTGGNHVWKWDKGREEYYCDECGVWEGHQED